MSSMIFPVVFQNAFRPILEWRLRAVNAQILRAKQQQESELNDLVWDDRDIQISELTGRKEALEDQLGL